MPKAHLLGAFFLKQCFMDQQEKISMEIVNPHAAGIDVGSRSHWVAVGQQEKDVREFGVFNQDLFEMANWLHENKVKIITLNPSPTKGSTKIPQGY